MDGGPKMMSTEYMLVEDQWKKELGYVREALDGIGAHCVEVLAELREKAPLLESDINSIEYDLKRTLRVCDPGYRDDLILGVSTHRGFSWRVDNDFHETADVQRYMDEHPGAHIEDEYGSPVSMKDFKKISARPYLSPVPSGDLPS